MSSSMGDLIIMALESSAAMDAIIVATSASGRGSVEVSLKRLTTSVWTALRAWLASTS